MRVIKACVVAVPVAVLLSVAVSAQDADKKVEGGGITGQATALARKQLKAEGWTLVEGQKP